MYEVVLVQHQWWTLDKMTTELDGTVRPSDEKKGNEKKEK